MTEPRACYSNGIGWARQADQNRASAVAKIDPSGHATAAELGFAILRASGNPAPKFSDLAYLFEDISGDDAVECEYAHISEFLRGVRDFTNQH